MADIKNLFIFSSVLKRFLSVMSINFVEVSKNSNTQVVFDSRATHLRSSNKCSNLNISTITNNISDNSGLQKTVSLLEMSTNCTAPNLHGTCYQTVYKIRILTFNVFVSLRSARGSCLQC